MLYSPAAPHSSGVSTMGYKNAQKRELMSSKTGEAIQKKKKETEAERLAREEKEDEEWGAPSPIAALLCCPAAR